jgi:hypothetical protein
VAPELGQAERRSAGFVARAQPAEPQEGQRLLAGGQARSGVNPASGFPTPTRLEAPEMPVAGMLRWLFDGSANFRRLRIEAGEARDQDPNPRGHCR